MSLRASIDVLFSRVEKLTELVGNHGIPVPLFDENELLILEQTCATLELPREKILPPVQRWESSNQTYAEFVGNPPLPAVVSDSNTMKGIEMTDQTQPVLAMSSDPQSWTDFSTLEPWSASPSDWPWQILNDSTVDMTMQQSFYQAQLGQLNATTDNSATANLPPDLPASSGTSDDEEDTAIVPHLAARFGSLRIGHDGRLRYFGTASNNHFLTNPSHGEPDFRWQDLERESTEALENAGLDREVPSELQEHLLGLFFQWHNPGHDIVDRTMFEAARANENGDRPAFWSPSLTAIMYASPTSWRLR